MDVLLDSYNICAYNHGLGFWRAMKDGLIDFIAQIQPNLFSGGGHLGFIKFFLKFAVH